MLGFNIPRSTFFLGKRIAFLAPLAQSQKYLPAYYIILHLKSIPFFSETKWSSCHQTATVFFSIIYCCKTMRSINAVKIRQPVINCLTFPKNITLKPCYYLTLGHFRLFNRKLFFFLWQQCNVAIKTRLSLSRHTSVFML